MGAARECPSTPSKRGFSSAHNAEAGDLIERSSRVSTKDGDQQYIFLQKESSNVAEVPEVPYPRLTAGWVARGRIVSRIGLFPRRDLPLASPPGSRSAPTICASISVNGLQRRGTWAASVGHRRQGEVIPFRAKGPCAQVFAVVGVFIVC